MVRFINKLSGQEMWVAEERVEEYKAAGHKLAVIAYDPMVPASRPKKKSTKRKGKASNERFCDIV